MVIYSTRRKSLLPLSLFNRILTSTSRTSVTTKPCWINWLQTWLPLPSPRSILTNSLENHHLQGKLSFRSHMNNVTETASSQTWVWPSLSAISHLMCRYQTSLKAKASTMEIVDNNLSAPWDLSSATMKHSLAMLTPCLSLIGLYLLSTPTWSTMTRRDLHFFHSLSLPKTRPLKSWTLRLW